MTSKTVTIFQAGGLEAVLFPKLTASGAVRHIFSTRKGGVSEGRYATMNLSFSNGDAREHVLKNYSLLCAAAGIDPSHLVLSHQTHTNCVRSVSEQDRGAGIFKEAFSDVDGLITNRPGVALVTQYADCTPLLFCDPVKRVIASSHAGWRGTVKEIGSVTVQKMIREYGCRAKDIIAAIGPCIGPCCYEVDAPVYGAFSALSYLSLDRIFRPKGNEKYMLDLREANRQILIHAGIREENMDIADLCTCCHCDELHSHRATHGQRGNMAAILELVEP